MPEEGAPNGRTMLLPSGQVNGSYTAGSSRGCGLPKSIQSIGELAQHVKVFVAAAAVTASDVTSVAAVGPR